MRMSGYVYNCSAGETWDMIALEIYGEETYAADLLCANPAMCRKAVFTGGEKVELPVIDVPERNQLVADTGNTAPWRR